MKASLSRAALPTVVSRGLTKLGADITSARKRRRLTTTLVAERAFISRNTLARVEAGDPGVSMGIYATVLFVLGLAEGIGQLADPSTDKLGLQLADAELGQRVRMTSAFKRDDDDGT